MSGEIPRLVVAGVDVDASGNSATLGIRNGYLPGTKLNLALSVTQIDGTTPTLNVSIRWSLDGGNTFCIADTTPDAFAEIDATGAFVKQFVVKGSAYVIDWAVAGTNPVIDFTIYEQVLP